MSRDIPSTSSSTNTFFPKKVTQTEEGRPLASSRVSSRINSSCIDNLYIKKHNNTSYYNDENGETLSITRADQHSSNDVSAARQNSLTTLSKGRVLISLDSNQTQDKSLKYSHDNNTNVYHMTAATGPNFGSGPAHIITPLEPNKGKGNILLQDINYFSY